MQKLNKLSGNALRVLWSYMERHGISLLERTMTAAGKTGTAQAL